MKIVALIGSSGFREAYIAAIEREARKGNVAIGLTPVKSIATDEFVASGARADITHDPAERQDLQVFKRDCVIMADEVLVLDVGGYKGVDTLDLIGYAQAFGKPLRYWSQEQI